MEPPPGCPGESPFGAAPPFRRAASWWGRGLGFIPGHLLSLETPCQPGMWRENAVRFPGRQVWVRGAGRSLRSVAGAGQPPRVGTANSLTGRLRGSSGGSAGSRAFFLRNPSLDPQSSLASHPNSWSRGVRRARGPARRTREAPGPGGEAPPVPVRGPGCRSDRLDRGRSYKDGSGARGLRGSGPGRSRGGPTSLRGAARPPAPRVRPRPAAWRGGGLLRRAGSPG